MRALSLFPGTWFQHANRLGTLFLMDWSSAVFNQLRYIYKLAIVKRPFRAGLFVSAPELASFRNSPYCASGSPPFDETRLFCPLNSHKLRCTCYINVG